MKKVALFLLGLVVLTPSFITTAKPFQATVKSPDIQEKIYNKTTLNSKRKIVIRYATLTPDSAASQAFNKLVNQTLRVAIQRFTKRSTQLIMNLNSSLAIKNYVLFYKPNKLISVQYEHFAYYSGSAYPTTTFFSINYNLATMKPLRLRDILQHSKKDLKYIAAYSIRILKTKNIGRVNFIREGAGPNFKNYQNWNFTKEGLLIIFNADQVAARVFGPQRVVIPYQALKGHIRLQYDQLVS